MSKSLRSLARHYETVNDSKRACTVGGRKTASMIVLGVDSCLAVRRGFRRSFA